MPSQAVLQESELGLSRAREQVYGQERFLGNLLILKGMAYANNLHLCRLLLLRMKKIALELAACRRSCPQRARSPCRTKERRGKPAPFLYGA